MSNKARKLYLKSSHSVLILLKYILLSEHSLVYFAESSQSGAVNIPRKNAETRVSILTTALFLVISNSNWTEWSTIQVVIRQVISKLAECVVQD